MSKPKLTNDDFCRAAKRLRCEVAAIKAVADTESRGNGFYADGFPVILFERHIFRKLTGGRYNATHPHLSGPAGNYGAAGQNQRDKFSEAFALDADAAMKSCSWGKFQIMGFNHQICGFRSAAAFVDAMKESEGRHLDAFVRFCEQSGLDGHIRTQNWARFARGYNGTGYKKNKYDTKMAAAYRRFARENIDCSQISAAASPNTHTDSVANEVSSTNQPEPSNSGETPTVNLNEQPPITETKTAEVHQGDGVTTAVETTQTQPKGDAPDVEPTPVTKNGPISNWLFSGGGVLAIGSAVWGFVQSNLNAIAVGIICLTLLIIVIIFRKALTDAIRMQTAADPDKKNVT